MPANRGYVESAVRQQSDPFSDIIQVAKNIAALLPTSPDSACGILSFTTRVRTNDNEEVAKVDYHQSDKNTMFVRYFRDHFDLPPDLTSPLTLNQSIQNDSYQDVTVGDTYLVSNTIVNSLHANLNRAKNVKGVPTFPEYRPQRNLVSGVTSTARSRIFPPSV